LLAGVRQVVRGDQLRDEALPRRVVEDVDEAERDGQHVDGPQPHLVRAGEHGEGRGQQACGGLGNVQHPAFVGSVGEQAAGLAEQEHRQETGRRGEPELRSAVGQSQHQERLRHRLHPGAALRDQLAEEEQPVVAVRQGCHGARGTVMADRRTARLRPVNILDGCHGRLRLLPIVPVPSA
jgi:hypothetical protein